MMTRVNTGGLCFSTIQQHVSELEYKGVVVRNGVRPKMVISV